METTDTQTRDIILRLKRVKAARGLSCGRICAMVAEAGGSVSLSTVKRVFADGSEDWSFRVCDTVQPIADVLLAEGGAPEVGSCERAAYQAIAEQQRELLGDMSAMVQDSSGDALSLAREQLAQYERRLRSVERRIVALVVLITLLLVTIIVALVVDGRLVIDAAEAETVRLIFGLYASGMTYREIIRRLNAEERRTKRGGNFGVNSLHDLLKNPKYVGDLVYGKVAKRPDGSRNSHAVAEDAIVVKDVLPAIVDRETWEKVQLKMQENKRSAAGRPASARAYPLKGKVFCRECKSAMLVTAAKRRGKRYYYYTCGAKHRKGLCDNSQIPVSALEGIVANAVRQRLSEPESVGGLIRILRDERAKLSEAAVQRLRAMQKRDREIAKQLDAAVNAVLGGLHSPILTAKVNALEAERAKISHDMQQLRAQVSGAEIDEPRLRELLALAMQDDAAVLSIVVRVEVGKDEIAVWTLLDADPNGDFDFAEDGVPITPSEVAPSYNNSGCPRWSTKKEASFVR